MRTTVSILAIAILAAGLFTAGAADAQGRGEPPAAGQRGKGAGPKDKSDKDKGKPDKDKGKPDKDKGKPDKDKGKPGDDEADEEKADAGEEGAEVSEEQRAKWRARLGKKAAEKKASRHIRKEQEQKRIRDELGKLAGSMAIQSALKVHARRMARLERILEIAEAAEDEDVLERVKKLIVKEQARHGKHLQKLKEAEQKRGEAKSKGGE